MTEEHWMSIPVEEFEKMHKKPEPEQFAQWFHEAYERLAPNFGYTTRKSSAVPWRDVPEPNKSLMIAVAKDVLEQLESWKNIGNA
ncbi:MAG: hypothetical protein ABWY25_07650 [Paenisporosarcina sp.]